MLVKLLLLIILVSLLFTNVETFVNNNKVYITCNNDYIANENDITSQENIKDIDLLSNSNCDAIKNNTYDYFPDTDILHCYKLKGVSGHCNPTNKVNYLTTNMDDNNDNIESPYNNYLSPETNYKVLYDIDVTNKILEKKGIGIRDNMNSSGVFSYYSGDFFSINI